MPLSVGLGRKRAFTAFALDPDLSILEHLTVAATHYALDGLAGRCPRKNNRPRYKSNGQNSCSIKHEASYSQREYLAIFSMTIGTEVTLVESV